MFGADDWTAFRPDSGESNADGGARSVTEVDSLDGADLFDRGRSRGEGG